VFSTNNLNIKVFPQPTDLRMELPVAVKHVTYRNESFQEVQVMMLIP